MNASMGLNPRAWACAQIPESQSVIRASGDTPLASTMTRPARPAARLPRCTKCQSFGMPRSEEYWHIGETHIRLPNVTERRVRGVKSWDMRANSIALEAVVSSQFLFFRAGPSRNRDPFSGMRILFTHEIVVLFTRES